MTHAVDWEAQIEEIKNKATAAARHSERVVSGVAHSLNEISSQKKSLSQLIEIQNEVRNRLGLLEDGQRNLQVMLAGLGQNKATSAKPTAVLFGSLGLVLGVVVSGVFLWS